MLLIGSITFLIRGSSVTLLINGISALLTFGVHILIATLLADCKINACWEIDKRSPWTKKDPGIVEPTTTLDFKKQITRPFTGALCD